VVSDESDLDNLIESLLARIAADPSNLALHRELRETALRRKAGGGAGSGVFARVLPLPRDPLRRLVEVERAWSLDPGDVQALLRVAYAVEKCAAAQPQADFEPVRRWLREIFHSTS
jgi:hypothetical protein